MMRGLDKIAATVAAQLVECGIDGSRNKDAVHAFSSLIKTEHDVLTQMAEHSDEFLKHYINSDYGVQIFAHHENLITALFGKASGFAETSLNKQTIDYLSAHLDNLQRVKLSDYSGLRQTTSQSGPLYKIFFQQRKIDEIDKNIFFWILENRRKIIDCYLFCKHSLQNTLHRLLLL